MKSKIPTPRPLDEIVAPKPELIEITLVDGVFANGVPFQLNVRPDQGDLLKTMPKFLSYTNGVTGQKITLSRPLIAYLSILTKMVEKPKSKAIKPLEP